MDISIPYNGMNNSIKEFNKIAQDIANPNTVDIAKDMVDMIQQKDNFKANAKVVKTYNELMGTIIDIFG